MGYLQERDKEFVGEGSRWFDLLRLRDSNGNLLSFLLKRIMEVHCLY